MLCFLLFHVMLSEELQFNNFIISDWSIILTASMCSASDIAYKHS